MKSLAAKTALHLDETGDLLKEYLRSNDAVLIQAACLKLDGTNIPLLIDVLKPLLSTERDTIRMAVARAVIPNISDDQKESLLDEYLAQDRYFYDVVTLVDGLWYAPEPFKVMYQQAEA